MCESFSRSVMSDSATPEISWGSSWSQGLNLDLLHCRRILYLLSHTGKQCVRVPVFQYPCQHLVLSSFLMSHFNMWIWYFTIFPISTYYPPYWGFPDSSFGKQSTCNARDPASIPGLGRSAGEGIGYPFQYSWASLVGQLVKNLPAMRETWVQSLGWEDPLDEGIGYSLQYSGLENSMDCIVHGLAKSQTQLSNFNLHSHGISLRF